MGKEYDFGDRAATIEEEEEVPIGMIVGTLASMEITSETNGDMIGEHQYLIMS